VLEITRPPHQATSFSNQHFKPRIFNTINSASAESVLFWTALIANRPQISNLPYMKEPALAVGF